MALVPVLNPLYRKIIDLFPKEYFRFCFAYGSGVFEQGGIKSGQPMVDMIFAVADSYRFHRKNLAMNPHHYSGVRILGPSFLSFLQENWPAYVYFNTMIPIPGENVMLKYGIVHEIDLIDDLLDWENLYLAGRLHKPVDIIDKPANHNLETALEHNLFTAVQMSLLTLPEKFTEVELYYKIANLSYNGDFRMLYGEDKNKVSNILEKQVYGFRKLYRPYIDKLQDYVDIPLNGPIDQMCSQDEDPKSKAFLLHLIPTLPHNKLIKYMKYSGKRYIDNDSALFDLACHPDLADIVSLILSQIVFKSSAMQSIKGILTAGFSKSLKYSGAKVKKMKKSQLRQ